MKKIIILILIVVIVVLGGFWLYSRNIERRKGVFNESVFKEKVSLRLKWFDQAQFAGNYVAKDKGFYESEGLEVSFVPYSYEETAIDAVLAGKAEFGIAGADEILVARSEGKPVKAIAVIYKINPGVFFTLKNSGITSPSDFVGKRVGVQKGVNTEYMYRAMMGKLGIDRSKITEVPVGFDYKELFNGDVVASVGYVINKPTTEVQKGKEVSSILMADYGVNMYADVLFTSDKMIEEKSEMVQHFVSASLKGWQEAIEHQDEAVDITMKYAKEAERKHQEYMLSSSVPLINTGKTRLGVMEPVQWTQMQDLLIKQKIMTKKIDITSAYAMKFVDAIYE